MNINEDEKVVVYCALESYIDRIKEDIDKYKSDKESLSMLVCELNRAKSALSKINLKFTPH